MKTCSLRKITETGLFLTNELVFSFDVNEFIVQHVDLVGQTFDFGGVFGVNDATITNKEVDGDTSPLELGIFHRIGIRPASIEPFLLEEALGGDADTMFAGIKGGEGELTRRSPPLVYHPVVGVKHLFDIDKGTCIDAVSGGIEFRGVRVLYFEFVAANKQGSDSQFLLETPSFTGAGVKMECGGMDVGENKGPQ